MSNKMNTLNTLQKTVTTIESQAVTHRYAGKIFASLGFTKLAEKYAGHAKEELEWADKFIDRLLDLGGTLAHEAQDAQPTCEDVEDFLKYDKQLSEGFGDSLNTILASGDLDITTYELYKAYLMDEEEDLNWTDNQLQLIATLGKQNYLLQQL